MEMSKLNKESFSNEMYCKINEALKVEHLRIELGELNSYNGKLYTLDIYFEYKGKELKVTYRFFYKDFLENTQSAKRYIIKLVLEEMLYI